MCYEFYIPTPKLPSHIKLLGSDTFNNQINADGISKTYIIWWRLIYQWLVSTQYVMLSTSKDPKTSLVINFTAIKMCFEI